MLAVISVLQMYVYNAFGSANESVNFHNNKESVRKESC
jgi:hypothetical protein